LRPQYKIELRVRNHTTIPRPLLIQSIAQCVPDGHTVDLQNPQIFVLVEVFKVCHQSRTCFRLGPSDDFYQSVCGVSIVKDYYKLQKFNVMEIASKKNRADQVQESGSRVTQIPKSTESKEVESKIAETS
jgi:tRNA acetyltransferase TAN1